MRKTNLFAVLTLALLAGSTLTSRLEAALGDALNPALTWTTSPDFPWDVDEWFNHDGTDAAISAMISDSEQSWIRTTVTGPGMLSFWWSVSSEQDADFLRFKVGTNHLEISGEVDWQFVSFPVPPGTQTVEWVYLKNDIDYSGSDAGWLDEVTFVAGPTPPYLYQSPQGTNAYVGESLVLSSVVLGTAPFHYQWQRNGTNLPGANSTSLTFNPVLDTHAGDYQVIVTNAYGAVTSEVASVTVTFDPLGAAVNSPLLLWDTTQYSPWEAQTNFTHDGVSAAQSGVLADGQASILSTVVTGPGTLTFWWKVSSETNSDILTLSVNGVEQARISGEVNWQKKTITIPAGQVALEWTYSKDEVDFVGDDTAWLDEVAFTATPPPRALSPSWFSGAFTVSFPTQTGKNYALEYQNTLGGTNWIALPYISGDGTVRILADPTATGPSRFYRVKQF